MLDRLCCQGLAEKKDGVTFTAAALKRSVWVKDNHVAISMDGRDRCQENIFIDSGKSLRRGLGKWIQYYNLVRGHSSLDDKTPDEVYYGSVHSFAEASWCLFFW